MPGKLASGKLKVSINIKVLLILVPRLDFGRAFVDSIQKVDVYGRAVNYCGLLLARECSLGVSLPGWTASGSDFPCRHGPARNSHGLNFAGLHSV